MMQEEFLELEQEVASLSELGPANEQQQQLGELGTLGSQQEAAELLSKLELLKANLVSVQQLLQDQQDEGRSATHQQVRAEIISGSDLRRPTKYLKCYQSQLQHMKHEAY